MRADPMPKRYVAEEAKLSALWLSLPEEVSYEDVVKEHGSKAYQDYYFGEIKRTNELRKQGIFVN